jgi:hypothetical protein
VLEEAERSKLKAEYEAQVKAKAATEARRAAQQAVGGPLAKQPQPWTGRQVRVKAELIAPPRGHGGAVPTPSFGWQGLGSEGVPRRDAVGRVKSTAPLYNERREETGIVVTIVFPPDDRRWRFDQHELEAVTELYLAKKDDGPKRERDWAQTELLVREERGRRIAEDEHISGAKLGGSIGARGAVKPKTVAKKASAWLDGKVCNSSVA